MKDTDPKRSAGEAAGARDAISTTRTLRECIAYYASPDDWGVTAIYLRTLTDILDAYGIDLDSEPAS